MSLPPSSRTWSCCTTSWGKRMRPRSWRNTFSLFCRPQRGFTHHCAGMLRFCPSSSHKSTGEFARQLRIGSAPSLRSGRASNGIWKVL